MTEEQAKQLEQKIPYKWRVQSFSRNKASCSCVAYIDSRDVQKLLDEVIGKENWMNDFKEVKGNLFGGVAIKGDDNGWVWKWDCGTESKTEAEKGAASDSFKRAAVQWGIGRFLYDLGIVYLKANDIYTGNNSPFPVDLNGERIWDVGEHINKNKR